MNDGTLYERTTAEGSAVRIRRTSAHGATPVVAVLEQLRVDGRDSPAERSAERSAVLSLLEVMAQTELDAVLLLEPYARTEAAVSRLARTRQ
jgi:hypothetical protein